MSTTVTYKGSTITTVSNETKTLTTAGTWLEDDIEITDSSSTGLNAPTFTVTWDDDWEDILSVTCNKTFSEVDSYYTEGIDTLTLIAECTESNPSEIYLGSGSWYLRGHNHLDPNNDFLKYVIFYGKTPGYDITYYGSGQIVVTNPSSLIKNSSDLVVSGATVEVTEGYYEYSTATISSGTAGTPIATKGTVSNHQVSVTPSVTNTTGYITGDTKTGTAVSVSASELVSGTYTVSSSGTKDVTNYASASVSAGSEGTPTATKGTVSNHSISVTPSVTNTGGWISGSTKTGTAVTVTASELASGNKEITANGTNIDVVGYSTASVAVPNSVVVTDTSNTTGTSAVITADSLETLITKTITENGTYTASTDSADGYSSVTVNVSGGGSGSGVMSTSTGTFTGSGGNTVQISCDFEPQEIYIYGDLTGDATLRGIVSFTMIKDTLWVLTNDTSTSNTAENNGGFERNIVGYNQSNSASEPYATYSNGVLTLNTVVNSSGYRFVSGLTYSYKLVGMESPTQHTIHLEFSDSTETDVALSYNDSLIGTMITAYQPSVWMYNNKTVTVAELDGTEWYNSSITWETLYSGTQNINEDSGGNYIYISQNTPISITQNSLWRITWNGTERTHTPIYEQYSEWINDYCIDGQNDGTNAPYKIWSQYNAWIIPVGNETGSVVLKIERAVVS